MFVHILQRTAKNSERARHKIIVFNMFPIKWVYLIF